MKFRLIFGWRVAGSVEMLKYGAKYLNHKILLFDLSLCPDFDFDLDFGFGK